MDYKPPGVESDRMRWILGQVNQAQSTLDDSIITANNLPDSELSKTAQILRLNSLKREVDVSFFNLDSSAALWANRDVPTVYKTGWFMGAAQTSANYDFSLPHRDALDILSRDAYDDVATRLQQYNGEFGRKIEAQKLLTRLDPAQAAAIQGKSRSAIAQALLTGEADPKKVAKKLADELWEDGVTIVDAGGNHWEMENYTRMLVRTKSANAYNSGTLNKYVEEGVERVGVLDGTENDQTCTEANGETWTIKYATEHVIAHPNCRRAFTPKAGNGRVNKKSAEEKILQVEKAAQGATQLLDFARALYDFRQTGEINISLPNVVRFTTEFAADKTGLPRSLVNLIVEPAMEKTFKTADAFIEALIDPLLFAAGFVKQVPPRAVLMRQRYPLTLFDELETSIKKTNLNQFGSADQNQLVVQLLNKVENRVKPALDNAHYLNKSAAFYRGLKERDRIKMLKVITAEFRKVNVYGEIVDDVVGAVLRGRVLTPDQFGAIRSVGRDEVTQTRLQRYLAASDSTQKFVVELRKFYKTGELDLGATGLSSTLTTATAVFVTEKTGIPQLVSEVLAPRSTAAVLNQSAAIIEAYVDPVLYSVGLIQKVSDRGALIALKHPSKIIDNIRDTIIRANNAEFGTDQHPKVVALLEALNGASVDALNGAGYVNRSAEFYEGLRVGDVTKMYKIVTKELRRTNNFGVQVDGVYNAVINGSIGNLVSDGFVAMREQTKALRSAVSDARTRMNTALEELTVVFADLSMKRAQLIQFLEGKMPSVTRPDVVDNLMRVEVPEGGLVGYSDDDVVQVLGRVDSNLEEVRKQKDDIAEVISINFGRKTTEPVEDVLAKMADDVTDDVGVVALDAWRKDTTAARVKDASEKVAALTDDEKRMVADRLAYIKARNAAADADVIPFPKATSVDDAPLVLLAGTGESVPINTRSKIRSTGARSGPIDTIGSKVPDPTGGRKLTYKPANGAVSPLNNTDLLTDAEMEDVVANLIKGFDGESSDAFASDVLDDFAELFNRIKADGEDGPLFLEIEQFMRPIGDKTTFETFEDLTQSLTLFRVVDGKAAIFGDTVSAAVEEQALNDLLELTSLLKSRYFSDTALWMDAISYSDNPMAVMRHLPTTDAGDYLARSKATTDLWDNIVFQMRRAIESDGSIDLTGPELGTLHTYLGNVYGKDNVVTMLAEAGANGALFKVTDAKGRSFIIKPMTAQHSGGIANTTLSHGLTDWMSIKLGEPTQVIHTTVIPLKQGVGQHIAIMPYFEGEQLRNANQFFTGNSMARLDLFDRIALEADPNWGNTMVNASQHRAVSIDTETAFGIVFGTVDDFESELGYMGNRVSHTKARLIETWADGTDDLTIGYKAPSIAPYKLTDAEELFVTDAYIKIGETELTSRRATKLDPFINEFRGLPILDNKTDPLQLMVGKAAVRKTNGVVEVWEPIIYAAEHEADLVRSMARGELRDEIRAVAAERLDNIQELTRRAWIDQWDPGGTLDSSLDVFADKISDNLRLRGQSLLNEGLLNTTGGVTTHISDDGTKFVLGEVAEVVNKGTGQPLNGIVIGIFDDVDGIRHVVIANEMGTGKTFDELADFFNLPDALEVSKGKVQPIPTDAAFDEFGRRQRVTIIADRWRGADVVTDLTDEFSIDDYGTSLVEHLDATPQRGVKSLRNEPLVAEVPIYNSNGVFTGYGRENIEIIVVNPGDGGIRFTDEANEVFISWERIVDDGSLNDIIRNQLRDVPPSERPRTVRVYFSPIKDSDGDISYGVMHMDRREMHISVQSATQTKTAPGVDTGRTAVKLDSVLKTDEDLIAELDWVNVRKVTEHEINHASDAGLEEAQRVTLSVNIHKQLIEEHPDVKSPADLDAITKKLIPDSYEPPRTGMSPTEQLVDFRATLVEDVENTRLVIETQEVIDDAVNSGVAQPWMQKAYNGIREGDADAHHEFYADWKSLLNPNKSSRKRILDALIDPDRALDILERRALPLPSNWDPNSKEFAEWLGEHLVGDTIIPRQRSAVRKYWRKEITGKSLADDIVRQFEKQAKGGKIEGIGGTAHLTGYIPDDGIAVARAANELKLQIDIDVTGVPDADDLAEAMAKYIKDNRQNFLTSDDWYLGYWVSPEGELVLDVSRVIDSGELDAAHFGFRENQRSMFHLGEGRLIELTDDSSDFATWVAKNHPEISEAEVFVYDTKIGAAKTKFAKVIDKDTGELVPSKRIEEIRDSAGKLVAISLAWVPKASLKNLKRSYTHEYRYTKEVLEEVRNKAGKLVRNKNGTIKTKTVHVPLKKKVTVTQKRMTANFEKVLKRAEDMFGRSIVPDSLNDPDWLARRRVDFVNQSTTEAGGEAMDDLRAAFKILDDNLIAKPPDGFALIVRDPTSIRRVSGKGPAPNGISIGRRTYLNTKWKNLTGTMSRSRTETILHEIGHQLDPTGTKGASLRKQGFSSPSKYGKLNDDELWSESFLAVMTGRADSELTEAVLGLVKLDPGLVRRNQLRFYEDWKNSYMLIAKETGISVGRVVANASHLSAGMVAEVNKTAGVWTARMVGDNHRFTAKEARLTREHYKHVIAFKEKKLVAALKKAESGRTISVLREELIGLKSGLKEMKTGRRLLDITSDVAGAYALQALSFEVQDKVLLNSGNLAKFSLTGSYGMPQVVRGFAVLRGSTTVNDSLGNSKIRSFYNNILDPKDIYGNGDVTVDFHMADMALFVLGMHATNHSEPSVLGIGAGLRPLVADTIRAIYHETDWAERLGAESPAELQEILWEIWRLGKKEENKWWGDLPRATRVSYSKLVELGWVTPPKK